MLRVTSPGLQSSLQGRPRLGARHFGLPAAGPADSLSMALANRLVGNPPSETSIEITFGGFSAEIEADCTIAITGAHGAILVSGAEVPDHTGVTLQAGQRVSILPPSVGARAYLAIHSGFKATSFKGSNSTDMTAGLGGYEGRALQAGDRLLPKNEAQFPEGCSTPAALRPAFTRAFALRACESAETGLLDSTSRSALFETNFIAGRQATRMGVSLTGRPLLTSSDGRMKSAPVFPGTVQCPPSGTPILLFCDAQVTGGYPRVASVARCDRHLLGQIRPGNVVRLLNRTPEVAAADYSEKVKLLEGWLEPSTDERFYILQ